MGIMNPKPRFGLETDNGKIYDYVDKVEIVPVANYQGLEGQWNLLQVRDLIAAGQPIETARINLTARQAKAKPASGPATTGPVNAATRFKPGSVGVSPGASAPATTQPAAANTTAVAPGASNARVSVLHHPATAAAEADETSSAKFARLSAPAGSEAALTAKDLEALNLSGGQKAALGLTLDEINVKGITALRKQQLGVTAARAKVLGLNDAQVKALGS
jgi:hypothetical protein